MPLEQFLLSPYGRVDRSSYWLRWFLPFCILGVVLNIVAYFAGWLGGQIWLVGDTIDDLVLLLNVMGMPLTEPWLVSQIKLWSLFTVFTSTPWWAVLVKRLHDRNKSGWWLLLGLIPFIGFIWLTVECGLLPGDDKENDFGLVPSLSA